VTERKEAREALKKAQESEIKQLQDLLPICSYCEKIRNDSNYREKIESYISNHSNALFSAASVPIAKSRSKPNLRT
jgi:hypothetical protein